ncbi:MULTISPECIES: class Ib ribonucleoside-diphosphate reductase assembly flavoprotein NrdI [Enterobacterales]|uniref:class Ib ribonucleoside-diphosphate reductase assembly flavoprotein NrdI n=1 Tax=Enterobacterales TaxID=91347 RepID=UPI0008481F76|nr:MULTISPECIES: class Ib ribonucleoside-diphosphate reductase assembly flavoprotein NrdI [Enterobacterales]WOO50769.1 class Ib ribonucleoside-diphosphate reductase assembly flavoprotein NrdI [Hafnia alvei]MCT6517579.1 class Ib ribonucleoside-diphosphate reductase assembly flavoprotein NrdI [Proteus vulgaris]ODQ01882.1 ribonucleotide reductase assembly protein NrdI [Shigella sp. FC130]OEI90457.1 ribonucleotide reductase assembly protein NrdI [Shigella sp. FC1655]OEJ07616.1 ribonucleotide reduc
MQTAPLIYFSSRSENCHRFIQKLNLKATRIIKDETLLATQPFVLLCPTYGGGSAKGAVPKAVIQFLNIPENRRLIRGVIASGNTNFGTAYGLAGDIIAQKCQIPFLYRFELLGTPEDVNRVKTGLSTFWSNLTDQCVTR